MSSELAMSSVPAAVEKRQSKRFLYFTPIAVFVGVAIALAWGLAGEHRDLPSTLIGKSVPQFDLPPVKAHSLGLSTTHPPSGVLLVTVFASWCVGCRLEPSQIMKLK